MKKPKRMSIDELESILNSDADVAITILPNGEVVQEDGAPAKEKPLTMKEQLGGEYACA